jgi:hypothetical protein
LRSIPTHIPATRIENKSKPVSSGGRGVGRLLVLVEALAAAAPMAGTAIGIAFAVIWAAGELFRF